MLTYFAYWNITECVPNSFGQDCKESCYCKKGTCDYVTGFHCPGGCAEGYAGETCSQSLRTTEPMITLQEEADSQACGERRTGIGSANQRVVKLGDICESVNLS